jgi:hypothetical protein
MMEYISGKHDSWDGSFRQAPRYRNGVFLRYTKVIGWLGCRRKETEEGVPASRAIHRVCPHTRGGRGKVQWGREEGISIVALPERDRGRIAIWAEANPAL